MASSKEEQDAQKQVAEIQEEDRESYIRLRESLDALQDAALVHYSLIDNSRERTAFADEITKGVVEIFDDWINTKPNKTMWENQKNAFDDRVSAASSNCPPGFMEVDGRCVRIGNPLMSKK